VSDALLLTHRVSFERFKCFFNSAQYTYFEQRQPISTMKNLTSSNVTFRNELSSHLKTMC
jgi:hypothetical protein